MLHCLVGHLLGIAAGASSRLLDHVVSILYGRVNHRILHSCLTIDMKRFPFRTLQVYYRFINCHCMSYECYTFL
uniref:Uncharacterized protein LOC105133193 n=1 Tax=Rhizophora mucronata TaxID=61149 RepID=A0A2P2KRN6_RHIMU